MKKRLSLPFLDAAWRSGATWRYFSQWPHVPPFKEGVAPDARKMVVARFMYGNWISGGTADQAHGFEIESFRIVGR